MQIAMPSVTGLAKSLVKLKTCLPKPNGNLQPGVEIKVVAICMQVVMNGMKLDGKMVIVTRKHKPVAVKRLMNLVCLKGVEMCWNGAMIGGT